MEGWVRQAYADPRRIVDNSGGAAAGGVTGMDNITRATAGRTFGFGSPGPVLTNPKAVTSAEELGRMGYGWRCTPTPRCKARWPACKKR